MAGVISLKYECPVCKNPLFPPVYQCWNGHLICGDCVPKWSRKCHTCREPMTMPTGQGGRRIRNLEVERIIQDVLLHSCPHEGCDEVGLKAAEYFEHKKKCVHRESQFCLLLHIDCKSETSLNDLVKHFQDSHKDYSGIEAVVSRDTITFNSWFSREFRGSYPHICLVTGGPTKSLDDWNEKNEKFLVAVVETYKTGNVHWSWVIIPASPAAMESPGRFVVEMKIRPGRLGSSAPDKLEPELPMIHYGAITPHCPESGEWSEKGDPCASMNHLKELSQAGDDDGEVPAYHIEARLFDKTRKSFYQFHCDNDDSNDAVGNDDGDAVGNDDGDAHPLNLSCSTSRATSPASETSPRRSSSRITRPTKRYLSRSRSPPTLTSNPIFSHLDGSRSEFWGRDNNRSRMRNDDSVALSRKRSSIRH